MKTEVLPGDTVGSICKRYGIERDLFFQLNPIKKMNSFVNDEGIRTAMLDVGEMLKIGEYPNEKTADIMYEDSGSSSFSDGGAFVIGAAFTIGVWYLIWRGIKSVAKESP